MIALNAAGQNAFTKLFIDTREAQFSTYVTVLKASVSLLTDNEDCDGNVRSEYNKLALFDANDDESVGPLTEDES